MRRGVPYVQREGAYPRDHVRYTYVIPYSRNFSSKKQIFYFFSQIPLLRENLSFFTIRFG